MGDEAYGTTGGTMTGPLTRSSPGQRVQLASVLSIQCMMPLTLEAAPLIRSNFTARAGSASGLSAAYRAFVRSTTIATAWSRSRPAARARRVSSTQTLISSADRSSVGATSVTGP